MVDSISKRSSPPSSTTDQPNLHEQYDLKEYRQQVFWRLLIHGKDSEERVRYVEATVESRCYLIDEFFRWV